MGERETIGLIPVAFWALVYANLAPPAGKVAGSGTLLVAYVFDAAL